MIKEVSRGHIKVEIGGKIVTVPGEMFFPPGNKMGFAINSREIKSWDYPYDSEKLSPREIQEVIEDIRQEFESGGHTLEVE